MYIEFSGIIAASAKKCRRSTELQGEWTKGSSPRGNNSSPSSISSPQGSPFTVQNPMKSYDGQSPGHTLMSPGARPVQSPMQLVPSPTMSMQLQGQPSLDCMVPVSANMSAFLPTVLESDDDMDTTGDRFTRSLDVIFHEQGRYIVDEPCSPESTMLGSAECGMHDGAADMSQQVGQMVGVANRSQQAGQMVGVADMSRQFGQMVGVADRSQQAGQMIGQNTPSGVVADMIDETLIQNTGNDAVTGIDSIPVSISSGNSVEVLGFK